MCQIKDRYHIVKQSYQWVNRHVPSYATCRSWHRFLWQVAREWFPRSNSADSSSIALSRGRRRHTCGGKTWISPCISPCNCLGLSRAHSASELSITEWILFGIVLVRRCTTLNAGRKFLLTLHDTIFPAYLAHTSSAATALGLSGSSDEPDVLVVWGDLEANWYWYLRRTVALSAMDTPPPPRLAAQKEVLLEVAGESSVSESRFRRSLASCSFRYSW